MFLQAVYFGHFLSFYTMQLEPPKTIGFVSMVHLFASTVTRIFASRETMVGIATYLLQWGWKYRSHNLTVHNQTDYASV